MIDQPILDRIATTPLLDLRPNFTKMVAGPVKIVKLGAPSRALRWWPVAANGAAFQAIGIGRSGPSGGWFDRANLREAAFGRPSGPLNFYAFRRLVRCRAHRE